MTTATPPRPSTSPQPRRPGGPVSTSTPAGAIDPFKLLKKHKFTLVAATIVGVGIGTAAHFIWRYTWPFWTASVVYQCTPPQDVLGETPGVGSGSEEELERFMATQVAIMMSDRVLQKAAEDPRLLEEAPQWCSQFMENGRFNQAEAVLELSDSIRAHIKTGTELIEMSMIWKEKKNVAGVVSTVNEAYLRDLNFQRRLNAGKEKDAVARAIKSVDAQIAKLTEERDTLLREAGVDSLDERVGSIHQSITLAQENLSAINVTGEAYQDELAALSAEAQNATGTPTYPDTMRQEVEARQEIGSLKLQIQSMEAELTGMRHRGIGPEHRDYKSLQGRIDGYKQELENKRRIILEETFHGRIDMLRQLLRQMAAQEKQLVQDIASDKLKMNDLLRLQQRVIDIQRQVDLLGQSKAEYQGKLTTLEQLDQLATASRVLIAEQVSVPTTVTFPKIYIMVPLGVIVTVGLVAGFVLVAETVDQRVKGPADIAMLNRTRVLGIVPHATEDPTNPKSVETAFADNERGVMAESYRQIRASIMKALRRGNHRSLLVVAGMPGSGASSIISNLALVCAAADQRVLVIDANLRRPRQHVITGTNEAPGLADVLGGTHILDNVIQRSADGRFDVLSAGSPDQRIFERLATGAMQSVLADAYEDYDLLLIDVAPAVVAGDAFELANCVDSTLLVTMAYAEKRGMVARLRNELEESRGEFLGVIINGVRSSAGGYFKRNMRATHQYQNT